MPARVKICGITTPQAMEAAAEAGADWVGFVFFPPSPRFVAPEQAAALSASVPGGPARVGLFVDPCNAVIERALDAVPLDALQVYATPARAAALRQQFGLPVWHATGIHGPADLPVAADGIDALLLDAQAPPGAPLPGGNAHPFDWSILHGWPAPASWMLAGGLTPANVADAIRISGAPAVDVSSGVERTRGVKDPALIRAFVKAARATPGSTGSTPA